MVARPLDAPSEAEGEVACACRRNVGHDGVFATSPAMSHRGRPANDPATFCALPIVTEFGFGGNGGVSVGDWGETEACES